MNKAIYNKDGIYFLPPEISSVRFVTRDGRRPMLRQVLHNRATGSFTVAGASVEADLTEEQKDIWRKAISEEEAKRAAKQAKGKS